ncbi:hypothetical protein L523_1797 [Bordetella bronchiseptica MBORD731]|nr:hypothetical protein L523_1797 [Bordetella bronchiseptica MBORD731]
MCPDRPRQGDRTAGHDARRLQHRPAGATAGRRRGRHHRRRRAEEDPADVRRLPRRQGEGGQGQRQRQVGAAELGRCRMVHQPSGSAAKPDRHGLQGTRRNQHGRPVARPRRHHAPRYPDARPGDAEEQARRRGVRARGRRQARSRAVHRIAEGKRPPGRLRRRRGRHRLIAQIGHQLGALVHRRRYPVRAQQALRRRLPGQQDRAHLLQHDGRRRRPADRAGRLENGNGRRGGTAPVRRQGHQEWRDHRRVHGQVGRAVRRSARRRPHSADHRPRPDRQGARGPGPAALHPVPPAQQPGRHRQGLHAGPEDGRPRLRPAGRPGHPPGHLLRAEDDLGGQPGHHRPDDPRRAEGPGLPGLLGRPGDAVVLPYRRLSQAGGRQDAPHPAAVHQHARRHFAAPRRRRHPLVAEPHAAARHGRHRRRLAHALPDRHFVPRRLGPGGLRRGDRRDAAGHAGIGAGALQGQDATRRHAARPGQCDPVVCHQARPADRGQARQEEHLLGPHPGNRRPARPEGRTSLRAVRRLGRTLGRRLLGAPAQRADHRVHQQQHRDAEVDDRQRL